MTPQSVGDAAQTMNPGSITGMVPSFQVIPRILKPVGQTLSVMTPQAATARSALVYPPGYVSGIVPDFDWRTQVRYYGVV